MKTQARLSTDFSGSKLKGLIHFLIVGHVEHYNVNSFFFFISSDSTTGTYNPKKKNIVGLDSIDFCLDYRSLSEPDD